MCETSEQKIKHSSGYKMKSIVLILTIFGIHSMQAVIYEQMRAIPKAELHLHLGGSYPLSYLKTIATDQEFQALERGIDKFVTGVDYHECFFVFDLISRIINTPERVEDGTVALCRELQADGVSYVEIRTGLKDLGSGFEGYLKAVLRGIERSARDGFKANVLLSIKRTSSGAYVQSTIDLALRYKDAGVVGIDLSDNSTNGDITRILPLLDQAREQGLKFVVHMGESPLETDQMILLEHLHPVRIGHGVHLCPQALAWIEKYEIPVEVCLSSSQSAKMVDRYAQHPGFELFKKGHPIALCTDDPLIFRTTLSQEYIYFAEQLGLSTQEMQEFAAEHYLYRLKK